MLMYYVLFLGKEEFLLYNTETALFNKFLKESSQAIKLLGDQNSIAAIDFYAGKKHDS